MSKISTGLYVGGAGKGTGSPVKVGAGINKPGIVFDENATRTESTVIAVPDGAALLLTMMKISSSASGTVAVERVVPGSVDLPTLDKANSCGCAPSELVTSRILYSSKYVVRGKEVKLSSTDPIGYITIPGFYRLVIESQDDVGGVYVEAMITDIHNVKRDNILGVDCG